MKELYNKLDRIKLRTQKCLRNAVKKIRKLEMQAYIVRLKIKELKINGGKNV